jgi:hypothetical protein
MMTRLLNWPWGPRSHPASYSSGLLEIENGEFRQKTNLKRCSTASPSITVWQREFLFSFTFFNKWKKLTIICCGNGCIQHAWIRVKHDGKLANKQNNKKWIQEYKIGWIDSIQIRISKSVFENKIRDQCERNAQIGRPHSSRVWTELGCMWPRTTFGRYNEKGEVIKLKQKVGSSFVFWGAGLRNAFFKWS